METQIFTQEDITHIKSVYKKIIDHEKRIADEYNKNRREVSNRDTLMRLLDMREREYQVKQELTLERFNHRERMMMEQQRQREEMKYNRWWNGVSSTVLYSRMHGIRMMHYEVTSKLNDKLKGIQGMINVYKLGDGVNSLTAWGLNSGLQVRPLRFRAHY